MKLTKMKVLKLKLYFENLTFESGGFDVEVYIEKLLLHINISMYNLISSLLVI